MTAASIVIAVIAVLAASTAFSMVGLGGGVLYVPILLALGVGVYDAAATSLFIIMAMAITAAIIYRRSSTIDWKLVLAIEPPTAALAFAGGLLASHIDTSAIKIIFAVALIIAGAFMLKPVAERINGTSHGWGYWRRRVADKDYVVHLPGLIPATSAAGFISGMIGISGGVFKLPAMVLIGHIPMRIAVGTSSLMIAITAIAGLSGHIVTGSFNILTALPLAAVASIGGYLGSSLSFRMKVPVLKVFVAVILFLVSIWMIISTLMFEV
jgi:uncharacterized membrane protein YfcA